MTEQKNQQEGVQLPPELRQHIGVLNARITNVNLAVNDLMREIDDDFKAMAAIIAALQKENAELKAKQKEAQKPR
jgi:hypothetical protein